MKRLMLAATAALFFAFPAHAGTDWKQVEQALGVSAAVQPGGVHRFGFPRSDLKVTLDGVALKPALALGSWLAFKDHGDHAMVMGDLVLTEAEVSPVMKRLLEGGIEITALHNHLMRATPAPIYMHVAGRGDAVKMAAALREALALSATPLAQPAASAPEQPLDLDTAALERELGHKGRAIGGVYQFGVARGEAIRESGMDTPPAMGTATAINFQPTGRGKAAVAGDFVLLPDEVNAVARTLRQNGIEVTAIHSHMLKDEPRLFMVHFWANDDALKLARGLRAALDRTNSARH